MNSIPTALPAAFDARVIASHGRELRVRAADGIERRARPARRDLLVVCGDRVACEYDAHHDETRIVATLPRRTALYRSSARGHGELIAANLSLLAVVVAPRPQPDFFLLDRYLAAAHCAGLQAVVLANKSDLGFDAAATAELDALGRAGYSCVTVSAHSSAGVAAVRTLLGTHTALLAGQSGAGKSSLLRALVPDSDALVGELTRGTDEGRHTTTTARLYDLAQGGELIDSPGVRDFAPAIDQLEPRALGFVEIEALQSACRFGDCRHMREPECAVRAAVADARMAARRYESYRRLRRLYEQLGERRAPGGRERS